MTEGRRSAPRLRSPAASAFLFGPYRFNVREQVLSNNGNEIELPPRAMKVLEHLVRRSGRVVSKDELLGLWGDTSVSEQSLSDAIRLIRRALDDSADEPRYIQTLYRRGYRFVAELTVQPDTAAEGAGPRLASRISGILAPVVEAVLRGERAIAWGLAAAMAIVAVVATGLWRSSSVEPAARPTVRVTMSLPEDLSYAGGLQISRDGLRMAYVSANDQLVIGNLDQGEFSPVPGAEDPMSYMFSPDGNWIAFTSFDAQSRELKKVALDGSPPVSLGVIGRPRMWGAPGLVYDDGISPFHILPVEGGNPRALTTLDGGSRPMVRMSMLPDGETVLFTRLRSNGEPSRAHVISLESGELKTVLEAAFGARYMPSGHLVFLRDNALWARPFDLARLEAVGAGVRLMENGWQEYGVSDSGTLVYPVGSRPVPRSIAVTVGHDGTEIHSWPLREDLYCGGPRHSPNGPEFAMSCRPRVGGEYQVWVGELERGTFSARPFSGSNVAPVWTPNGRSIVHSSAKDGRHTIVMRPADSSGTPRALLEADYPIYPQSFSADGEFLAYQENHPQTGENIRLLPLQEGGCRWILPFPRRSRAEPCSHRMASGSPTIRTSQASSTPMSNRIQG